MRIVILIVVLSFATPSSAEPVGAPREKVELLAFAGTAVGTYAAWEIAVKIASGDVTSNTVGSLGLAGIIALPSLGHAYAESWLGMGIGLGSRAAGLGLVLLGNSIDHKPGGCDPDFDSPCKQPGYANTVIGVGMALVVGSVLFELFHAPYAAHRFNQRHSITLTPTAISGGGGLALGGQF
ncbi:MAG: hypothetical protein WKG01_40615 [Kofleriaceae bacterium]